jgi:hypothetical protein
MLNFTWPQSEGLSFEWISPGALCKNDCQLAVFGGYFIAIGGLEVGCLGGWKPGISPFAGVSDKHMMI